jgi:hypothetical protein
MGDNPEPMQTGKFYMAEGRGSRVNMGEGTGLGMTIWAKPDGTSIMLQPAFRTAVYIHATDPADLEAQGNSPDAYIRKFLEMTGDADRHLGRMVKDGREVEGFEVSAARLGIGGVGSAAGGSAQPVAQLWVDVKTRLPVLMEVETVESMLGQRVRAQCDSFEWNVPLEAELFEPRIAEDLRTVDVTMPPRSEQTLVDGLRLYADTLGRYPTVLDPARASAELGVSFATQGKLDIANPLSKELLDASLLVAQACGFCQKLSLDRRNPEYFGGSVTPADASEVLLRWRLEDGQMRVVYGDLHTATLPAAP